jgi:hypothetical protein
MKTKSLQNLALIAEIIGAIAVVISLIYVGIGVRQNTDAISASNHQALVAMDIEKTAWLKDSEFAALYVQALKDVSQLSRTQEVQVGSFVSIIFNTWELIYFNHNDGLMSDKVWEGWSAYYEQQLKTNNVFKWWWNKSKMGFTSEFRLYVDSISQTD